MAGGHAHSDPAAETTFTLHGTSSASPMNTLRRAHLSGAIPKGISVTHPGTGYEGQLTFSNRQPMFFDRMGNFTFVM